MSTNPFFVPNDQPVLERIGAGPRIVAAIIDMLGTMLLSTLLIFILMNSDIAATQQTQETLDSILDVYSALGVPAEVSDFATKFIPAMMLAGTIAAIAYSLIEGLTGASPGKRIMRIRICNADASAASLPTLLFRWSLKNISSVCSFLALAPFLAFVGTIGSFLGLIIFFGYFAMLGVNRQALYDIIAKTAVYRVS